MDWQHGCNQACSINAVCLRGSEGEDGQHAYFPLPTSATLHTAVIAVGMNTADSFCHPSVHVCKCSDVHVQGNWQLAEQLFQQLEAEARAAEPVQASSQTASPSSFNAYAVDWAASQPAQADANSGWEHQQPAARMTSSTTPAMAPINISVPVSTSASVAEVDDRRLSSGSFGDMPTHIAEQVGYLTNKWQPVVAALLRLHGHGHVRWLGCSTYAGCRALRLIVAV